MPSDHLDALVRDVVAPILRPLGFKRSSGTFRAVTDRGVALIQVSGRGGIGLTDLDFHVEIGCTTNEHLASAANVRGVSADRITITDTYAIWHDRVWDPSSPMAVGPKWRFNVDDIATRDRFATMLRDAAADVLERLDALPSG